MRKFLIFLGVACFSLALGVIAAGAQPRPIEKPQETKSAAQIKPAPESFPTKYEGGMFGFSQKEEGVLKFDDINERIIFFGKDGKEKFHLAYDDMLMIYAQSKSVTSTTGNVVKNIPLPGAALAGLIKEKRRYLIVHFQDADADAKGAVNFKIEDKDLLDSVIVTLGKKANMTQRGDAYLRPKVVVKKDD